VLPQQVSAVHDVLFFEYFDGDPRSRARGEPSDRMDRAGGRRHPPQARLVAVGRRNHRAGNAG
jgi:hypothetical protein